MPRSRVGGLDGTPLPRACKKADRAEGVTTVQRAAECFEGDDPYHSKGELQVITRMFDALLRLSYGRFNLTDARVLLLDGPSFRLARTAISVGIKPWNVHIANNQGHNIAEHNKVASAIALLGAVAPSLLKRVLQWSCTNVSS